MTMAPSAEVQAPRRPLIFEPHREPSTLVPTYWEGQRGAGSPWDILSREQLYAIERRWTRTILARVRESALALQYQAAEAEDRALAEAGIEDYEELLSHADRAGPRARRTLRT